MKGCSGDGEKDRTWEHVCPGVSMTCSSSTWHINTHVACMCTQESWMPCIYRRTTAASQERTGLCLGSISPSARRKQVVPIGRLCDRLQRRPSMVGADPRSRVGGDSLQGPWESGFVEGVGRGKMRTGRGRPPPMPGPDLGALSHLPEPPAGSWQTLCRSPC